MPQRGSLLPYRSVLSLLLTHGGIRHEAARLHHGVSAARRRCGRCRACATAASACGASVCCCPEPRTIAEFQTRVGAFAAGFAASGLDHRPQRAHRHRWATARCRRHGQARGGIGCARAGRHSAATAAAVAAVAAGDPHRADRVRASSSIRSVPASSQAWRGQAATPPGLSFSNMASARNGWSCSKKIAPGITRVAVLRDPTWPPRSGQLGAIQSVAPSLGVELRPVDVRDAGEIERAITAFARSGMAV